MLEVQMFGDLRIFDGNRQLGPRGLGGGKPRQVFEVLVLHRGQVVSKDRLAELLWAGRPPGSWLATVESYVSLVRARLEPGAGRRCRVITTAHGGYTIPADAVRTDLDRFDELTRDLEGLPATSVADRCAAAVALAERELLAHEAYADWVLEHRARYEGRVVAAAVQGARGALAADDPARALRLASGATSRDPLSEEAWTLLASAQHRSGRRSDALRTYERMRRSLADELGVTPGAEARRVFLDILRDGPVPDAAGLEVVVAAAVELHQRACAIDAGAHPITPRGGDRAVRVLLDLLESLGVAGRPPKLAVAVPAS